MELFHLRWPKGGLVKGTAFSEQPPGTTTDCLNVRNYDTFDQRNRGGQRTGMSKFFADRPTSSAVQCITQFTEAVALTEDAGYGDKRADPSTVPEGNGRSVDWNPTGTAVVVAGFESANNPLRAYVFDQGTGIGTTYVPSGSPFSASMSGEARFSPDGTAILSADQSTGNTLRVFPFTTSSGFGTPNTQSLTLCNGPVAWHPDGDVVFAAFDGGVGSRRFVRAYNYNSSTGFGSVIDTVELAGDVSSGALDVHPDGDYVAIGFDAVDYLSVYEFDKTTGFGSAYNPPVSLSNQVNGCRFSPDGTHIAVASSDISGASSDMGVYTFSKSTGLALADTASLNVTSTQQVAWHPDGTYIAVVDSGTAPFVRVYPWSGTLGTVLSNPATAVTGDGFGVAFSPLGVQIAVAHTTSPYLTVYDFNAERTNPSARKNRIVAVQGGNVYRSNYPPSLLALSNSGSGVLSSSGGVSAQEAFQKVFFVDGVYGNYKYLDAADNTVKDWTTNLTAGSLPQGSDDTTLGCTMIALYRGRIVLSGLREEPQNWFMSKAGDPFDFDYSPTTTSQVQAVAGNNSNVGQLGDIVTCLAPYQDDVMMIGGANSLWVMRGDPAAGGAIDNISRQVGVVGPEAWTWDLTGNFYFFSVNGLYRLASGASVPEPLTSGKLDDDLGEVDITQYQVRLEYDPRWHGVWIALTPLSEPSASVTCYFYDDRNDAFWPDTYPTVVGPTAVWSFKADDPTDTAIIFGGFDGYIRQFDETADTDDGTAINSHVYFSPINPGDVFAFSRMDDVHFVLDQQSDPVTLEVWSGDTVEEADRLAQAGSKPAFKRTLKSGRNNTIRHRRAGNTFIVKLSQAGLAAGGGANWAYETGGGKVSVINRMRGRHIS